MKRIIRSVFVGGKELGFNCLKILINKNNPPLFVVGNLDDNGKDNIWHKSTIKLAKKNKIKILKLKELSKKIYSSKLKNIDIIFCIGSTQILPENAISFPKLGCLNFHPSLLPKYRGRYSTVHSIFNGDAITGVTAHWIGKKIDAGSIISKKKIKIKPHYTARDLYLEFTKISTKLFLEILKKLEKKRIKVALPVIKKNFQMNFIQCSLNKPLIINKYGIPEPSEKKIVYPDILLIPLVAFDKKLNRLGYGAGFYDRFIYSLKKVKKIITIGLAFHFQQVNSIPISRYDQRLDYIITNKEILK